MSSGSLHVSVSDLIGVAACQRLSVAACQMSKTIKNDNLCYLAINIYTLSEKRDFDSYSWTLLFNFIHVSPLYPPPHPTMLTHRLLFKRPVFVRVCTCCSPIYGRADIQHETNQCVGVCMG